MASHAMLCPCWGLRKNPILAAMSNGRVRYWCFGYCSVGHRNNWPKTPCQNPSAHEGLVMLCTLLFWGLSQKLRSRLRCPMEEHVTGAMVTFPSAIVSSRREPTGRFTVSVARASDATTTTSYLYQYDCKRGTRCSRGYKARGDLRIVRVFKSVLFTSVVGLLDGQSHSCHSCHLLVSIVLLYTSTQH